MTWLGVLGLLGVYAVGFIHGRNTTAPERVYPNVIRAERRFRRVK